MASTNDLPIIPKEWNLTDEQRASMINAQKKTIALDNSKRETQKKILDKFMSMASQSPPNYSILVVVKQNNKITQQYSLTDNNKDYLFAPTFEDATSRVKLQLADPKSELQTMYAKQNPGSNKLRISSDNIKSPPKIGKFSLNPNSNYKYWEIITTNAAPSFFSNMRQSMRGGRRHKKGKGTRRNKKGRGTRKARKSKRRMR